MKNTILILFCSLFTVLANAQKADQFNSWWYYSGSYKIKNKIDVQSLYSWSRNDFIKNRQISLFRLGLKYKHLKNIAFGSGYEWAVLFPYGKYPVPENRIEHRIYEQMIIKNKFKNLSLTFDLQLEQRFIDNNVKHRSRARLTIRIPVIKNERKETFLAFSFFNQLLVNIGKVNNSNYLGQNRAYGGIDIRLHKTIILRLGYLNQYIIIDDTRLENNHTLMFGFFHKLNFMKKQ